MRTSFSIEHYQPTGNFMLLHASRHKLKLIAKLQYESRYCTSRLVLNPLPLLELKNKQTNKILKELSSLIQNSSGVVKVNSGLQTSDCCYIPI